MTADDGYGVMDRRRLQRRGSTTTMVPWIDVDGVVVLD
jgi:hypothetical protein